MSTLREIARPRGASPAGAPPPGEDRPRNPDRRQQQERRETPALASAPPRRKAGLHAAPRIDEPVAEGQCRSPLDIVARGCRTTTGSVPAAAPGQPVVAPSGAISSPDGELTRLRAAHHPALVSLSYGLSLPAPDAERHPSTWQERRPRVEGLALALGDREQVRRADAARERCGGRWTSYRKPDNTASGDIVERRMVVMIPCGRRACPRCFKAQLHNRVRRVVGRWKLAWVLTLDQRAFSKYGAWTHIHRGLELFFKRFQKRFGRVDALSGRIQKPNYAWVIEAHKSGYPHIHWVTDLPYVPHTWVRRTWEDVMNSPSAWCRFKPVYNKDQLARYLAKYLAKQHLTDDLMGLLYRRRLFASTLPKDTPEKGGWVEVAPVDTLLAERLADGADQWGSDDGWRRVWHKTGVGVEWERPLNYDALSRAPDIPGG